jgi:iron complex transport system ATP-binding protein
VPLLSAQSCSIQLAGARVVREVDFELSAGSFTALLGPNGSGKTTLLRAIGGALPYMGRLDLDGRPVRDWPARARARRIAFVRQAPALSFDLSVSDLVALGRAPHKRFFEGATRADDAHIADALRAVELTGFEERSARSLSGGERQRAFLAQALAQEADLLLLDEPTAHLDVHHQYAFLNRVRRFTRDEGRTVLAAVHDLERAARYADRLLVLHPDGRLAAQGPPADVLTPALVAEVFQMQVRVERPPGEPLRMRYAGPVGAADTEGAHGKP